MGRFPKCNSGYFASPTLIISSFQRTFPFTGWLGLLCQLFEMPSHLSMGAKNTDLKMQIIFSTSPELSILPKLLYIHFIYFLIIRKIQLRTRFGLVWFVGEGNCKDREFWSRKNRGEEGKINRDVKGKS